MVSRWADEPHSLISIRGMAQNTSHSAYYVATEMACAHNGMIRGLNSIYLQATRIPSGDLSTIRDFLTYCQCWCESMHHHHDAEESAFFPDIERIAGDKGLMANNIEQHRAFTPGFERFQAYSQSCQPKDYDGEKIKSLVEDFAAPLIRHLYDEVETLKALDQYNSEQIRQAYKRLEKILMNTDNNRIAPLVFGTSDRGYEGGVYRFPAVQFFVPYIVHYVFARKHHGAWRFNPCTVWGDRRDLAFPTDKS